MADVNSILNTYKKNKERKTFNSEENLKKYFNPIVPEGKQDATFTFRMSPVEGSPFNEAFFHEAEYKYKGKSTKVKIYCHKRNDGEDCPYCNVAQELKDSSDANLKESAKKYYAKKYYIIEGVDRAKPEDGKKFWRFANNFNGDGPYDKIVPLFEEKGDMTDPKTGRDMKIKARMEKANNGRPYSKITTILPEDKGEFLEDPEHIKAFEADKDLTWKDVYKKKDVSYMEVLLKGLIPFWDDNLKKYVGKSEEDTPTNSSDPNDEVSQSDDGVVNNNAGDADPGEDDLPF